MRLRDSDDLRARFIAQRRYLRFRNSRRNIAIAAGLIALKATAMLMTGSVALLANLAKSVVDAAGSVITFTAIRHSVRWETDDYRFGRGKLEGLAVLAVAFATVAATLAIVALGVQRALAGTSPREPFWGLAAVFAALMVTTILQIVDRGAVAAMSPSMRRHHRRQHLLALTANVAPVVALVADPIGGLHGVDAGIGMALAVAILGQAVWSAWHAIELLMDKEWPDPERQRLIAIIARHPAVLGAHDLRTRSSGGSHFAQVHLVLDGTMLVAEAMQVVRALRDAATADYPAAELLFHIDPAGKIDDPGNLLVETDLLSPLRPRAS